MEKTTDKRRFTVWDQFCLSCLWLGYNVQWGALLAVVLPDQIQALVGPERKEFYNGLIGAIGSSIALIVPPLAGALSDRSRHPLGRRRPYLLAGVLVNVAFLLYLAGFGPGASVWLFALGYIGIQFGCNTFGGPYAGLIPDVVPEDRVGRASGWQALMTAVGFLAGALAAGQLVRNGVYWPIYAVIAVSLLLTMAVTVMGVPERPRTSDPGRFDLAAFLRSFLLDPKEHRDFYWVLITRALVTMGVYSVFTFFQYFLGDVIGVRNPVEMSSYLIATIIGAGIPTTLVAGSLSDRFGRKPLVYFSGGIMAAAATIYVAVAFAPNLALTFAVAALFGIGNGAYQAVDWALAVDVLPSGEDAAKDMGIWHVAIVLPQIAAPLLTGAILTALKAHSLLMGYTVVFLLTAMWFVLGTVFVRQIRGVR